MGVHLLKAGYPLVVYDANAGAGQGLVATGARRAAGAATASTREKEVQPLGFSRYWKVTPLSGVTRRLTAAALGAVPARNIRPALAHPLVKVRDATRTVSVWLPDSVREAKWNWSDWSQMSAPAPRRVQVVPSYALEPARAGWPTSAAVHPAGSAVDAVAERVAWD